MSLSIGAGGRSEADACELPQSAIEAGIKLGELGWEYYLVWLSILDPYLTFGFSPRREQ
jgi:hypothetical protein